MNKPEGSGAAKTHREIEGLLFKGVERENEFLISDAVCYGVTGSFTLVADWPAFRTDGRRR